MSVPQIAKNTDYSKNAPGGGGGGLAGLYIYLKSRAADGPSSSNP